jgi:hypothetical protein
MKLSEVELDVWYIDRLGRRLRALDFHGSKVRYEDDKGTVGDMDAKTFASRCVVKADPGPSR